jgi:serine/threonine protein kinase
LTSGTVERIAHYRILRRIGRGGMGIVYQAVDERDGRPVALKVIREAEAMGSSEAAAHVEEARIRFDREAGILKSLLHVNVVSFYEIGEEDGTPYLAMEYLDGVALTTFAGRPYPETLPLLVQAAHGMDYLASRGIIHRDLSPDNILVIERGGERIVKLLDFGIAKLFEKTTGLESLTATGFFLGKVAYGSPEQLGALPPNGELDWRSDVYSLGVIFYQVLAGRRPFEAKAPVEYIAAHLNTAAPPVGAPPGVPPLPMELVRLIGQMLAKRREGRPKSYREIVDRLVAVLREPVPPHGADAPERSAGGPPSGPTAQTTLLGSLSPTPPQGLRSRLPLVAGTAIFTLFALAGVAVWVSRHSWSGTDALPPAEQPAASVRARATPGPPVPPGRLQILATPYARVVSITEAGSERSVPLPANATTPFVTDDVAPGRYRVVLVCAALQGRMVEREVTVSPGATALLTEPFLSTAALAATLK